MVTLSRESTEMVRGYVLRIYTSGCLIDVFCVATKRERIQYLLRRQTKCIRFHHPHVFFLQYQCYFNSRYFLAVMEDRKDGCIVERELFYLDIFLCCCLHSSNNVQLQIQLAVKIPHKQNSVLLIGAFQPNFGSGLQSHTVQILILFCLQEILT